MAAIFKRETKSYYTGMVGYVTAAVSLFFLGLYFTNRNRCTLRRTLRPFCTQLR